MSKNELVNKIKIPVNEQFLKKSLKAYDKYKTQLENLIKSRDEIDKTIDDKIYGLYEITDKEIRVVEKNLI